VDAVPKTLTRPAPVQRARALAPGLLVVAGGVLVSLLVHRVVPVVSSLVVAVVLGAVLANTGLLSLSMLPGVRFAARRLLRAGVVLLGLQLAIGDVVALGPGIIALVVAVVVLTFSSTVWLGARMKVARGTALLIAAGTSICGASAVAATSQVSDTDEDDVATALASVTLFGTIAMLGLPLLLPVVHLSPEQFGTWAGASVHEVAQVVGAAAPVSGALAVAVVVKLTRVVPLAPTLAALSVLRGRDAGAVGQARPPLVPLFVAGFLAMVAVRSLGVLPTGVLDGAATVDTVLLTAALFGLGAGVNLTRLRAAGARPLLLGLLASVTVSVLALAGVLVLHELGGGV
jgi:uncharacterized integral membrane protein (TIGR00698 family)